MITAYLSEDTVTSSSPDAFSSYEKSRFGEKKQNQIEYTPIEALFLVKDKKMRIFTAKKEISIVQLTSKLKKYDKKILTKMPVYKDLRKKGYIVKAALKFGAEFRIYEKGIKPGQDHARWLLHTAKAHENISWHDFAAKNRVAHAAKKNLLLAIVDDESSVSYYEIAWTKP